MMSVAEWSEHCARVKDAMRNWVTRFVTPISMSVEHGHGRRLGNGMGECLIRAREQQDSRRHKKQGSPLPGRSMAIRHYFK